VEVTEEIYFNYEEPYKLHSFEIIEDEKAWNEDNLNSHLYCSNNDKNFDSSYKIRAVEYWRFQDTDENSNNRKRNRLLKVVQNKFRRVLSTRQLQRWEAQSGGSRTEKLSYISKFTHDNLLQLLNQDSWFMILI